MATKEEQGISEVVKKYKSYCAEIFETFEDYTFQDFYLPQIHKQLTKGTIPLMDFEPVYSNNKRPFKKEFVYGVISRQQRKIIGQRSLLSAVSATEDFLQKVTFRVYRDFETKLETSMETPDQQSKLLKIIVDSSDKTEIIRRIAEEKIRGIFYGNPADFFEKDKAKIGLNNYFRDNYKLAIEQYKEVIARRNILTHNNGHVDRKYMREVKNTTYVLDEKVLVTKDYLKESIFLLHGLSTIVLEQVIKNNYGAIALKERFDNYIKIFDKKYKGK
jgi:hypothetical protein